MSDLPTTSSLSDEADHDQVDTLTSENLVDNQTTEQEDLENNETRQTIEEEREENPIEPQHVEVEFLEQENNQVLENQNPEDREINAVQNQGMFNGLFNRANILRVFNGMFADYDVPEVLDLSDDDDNDEEEDQNVYFNESEGDDYELEDEMSNQDNETDQMEEYNNAELPENMNYDTALPSTHEYLGENFEEISAPKSIHEQNDELDIPLLPFPGTEIYFRNETNKDNDVQLLPGQVMPLFFYAPLQVQLIKKRMKDKDPTIGFALTSKFFKQLLRQEHQPNLETINDSEQTKLGILAEIMSVRDESSNTDTTSMMHGTEGLVIKVKGRERFQILNVRREITGCFIATVKILPDIVLKSNPLMHRCPKNTNYLYDSYLFKDQSINHVHMKNIQSRMDVLNTSSHPTWLYRKHDCDYMISLIVKELETFNRRLPFNSKTDEDKFAYKNPLQFSNWLMNNFPFNQKSRIDMLNLNCVNQRLIYMYKILKSFTNINCNRCNNKLCSQTDMFSISKQGFMNPYLNPGGFVHETLTVYKLINFNLSRTPPQTEHSWFPGYGWQIISCRSCNSHIGWKFTTTNEQLLPQKFFGLTRKSIINTVNTDEEDKNENKKIINANETRE